MVCVIGEIVEVGFAGAEASGFPSEAVKTETTEREIEGEFAGSETLR